MGGLRSSARTMDLDATKLMEFRKVASRSMMKCVVKHWGGTVVAISLRFGVSIVRILDSSRTELMVFTEQDERGCHANSIWTPFLMPLHRRCLNESISF